MKYLHNRPTKNIPAKKIVIKRKFPIDDGDDLSQQIIFSLLEIYENIKSLKYFMNMYRLFRPIDYNCWDLKL